MSRQIGQVRSVKNSVCPVRSCVVSASGLGAIDLMCVIADLEDSFGGRPGFTVFFGLPPLVAWDRLTHSASQSTMLFPLIRLDSALFVFLILCLRSLNAIQYSTTGVTEMSRVNGLGVSTDIDAECFLELECKLGTFVAAGNFLRFGEEIATDPTQLQ